MKSISGIIVVVILCLVSVGVYALDLNSPQNNFFSNIPTAPSSTLAPMNISDSEYSELSTIEVPRTQDSKTPVFRYTNENLPLSINGLVDYIDFQATKDKKGQVYVYFKLPAADATVNQSKEIAEFIYSRKEWIGDRSLDSISAEIYIHWVADNAYPLFNTNPVNSQLYKQFVIGAKDQRPSPVSPTHLGYNYAGLDKTNLMDQFLLTL